MLPNLVLVCFLLPERTGAAAALTCAAGVRWVRLRRAV